MDRRSLADPTLLLWLVCSEWGWKNVKGHLMDRVSPEGREDEAEGRGASLATDRVRKRRRETGRAVQHCTSHSLFSAPRFLKSCCPERSEEHRPSCVRTAASLRREGN